MSVTAAALNALSNATARFASASTDLLASVSGQSNADSGAAIAQQIEAKTQFDAGVGVVKISDEMYNALIQVGLDTSYSQNS